MTTIATDQAGCRVESGDTSLRLDIGCGEKALEGFVPVDRRQGAEAYPLEYPDDSVDEIHASHVLEHFSHRESSAVLNDWVRVLKPGGRIRLAVPDFDWICTAYKEGRPENVQGYLMGGHSDENDHHGAAFDAETLSEIMFNAGLEQIREWRSDGVDCAALPVSLNLEGIKPISPIGRVEGTVAILSAPRFGHVAHFSSCSRALMPLSIPTQICQGAYWHQVLCEAIEEQIAKPGVRFVLTMDYDSVFHADDVIALYRLANAFPDVGAICSLQMKRSAAAALMTLMGEDGQLRRRVWRADLDRHLVDVNTGHFGLTIIRADLLRELPRPWMVPEPNGSGRWGDGHRDADIDFWARWKGAGHKVAVAMNVPIGHIQEVVTWPDENLKPHHQYLKDWTTCGKPPETW